MKGTGVFVTKEELEELETLTKIGGMWMSGGIPYGDSPEYYVGQLTQKYNPPQGSGLNPKTGEFMLP